MKYLSTLARALRHLLTRGARPTVRLRTVQDTGDGDCYRNDFLAQACWEDSPTVLAYSALGSFYTYREVNDEFRKRYPLHRAVWDFDGGVVDWAWLCSPNNFN